MPGFIENNVALGSQLGSPRDSESENKGKEAKYKVIPDYLKHIENEVKLSLRDLKQSLIDQGHTIRKEAKHAHNRIREEMRGDIAAHQEATKNLTE